MKILGLLDNYGAETDGRRPSVMQLTDASLLQSGKPFFIPSDNHDYEAFPSVAIRISRLGKSIPARFAHRYFSQATIGLNIRDMDRLRELSQAGLPWAEAVAFDYSAPIGTMVDAETVFDPRSRIEIDLCDTEGNPVCGQVIYRTSDLIADVYSVIEMLSQRFTLKEGDIIFVGYAPFPIPAKIRHNIICRLGSQILLKTKIR